ncbi:hypothetical protein CXT76_02220 [Candidatus Parvarchaeota archaeon]|nr:MAG: hypothetical protein CXT76_02220 [Candidatus Parvarchaeota archaeon]
MNQKEANRIKELMDYFRKNLEKGYSVESLKWALVSQGNSKREILKALQIVEAENNSEINNKEQTKNTENSKIKVEPKKSFWKNFFNK